MPEAPNAAAQGALNAAQGEIRRKITELLVLTFSKCEAKDLVGGVAALRQTLEWQLSDMLKSPGAVQLQPLWDLLARQPGFKAETVYPALCRFKTYELQVGMLVSLPREMATLEKRAFDYYANQSKVQQEELMAALDPAMAAAKARPAGKTTGKMAKVEPPKRNPAMVAGLAAVLAVAGWLLFRALGH